MILFQVDGGWRTPAACLTAGDPGRTGVESRSCRKLADDGGGDGKRRRVAPALYAPARMQRSGAIIIADGT